MILYYTLDADGNPVPCDDSTKLGEWMDENPTARTIDFTKIPLGDGRSATVSTVFLGINHRFGEGAPLLFETMVFGGPLDDECRRYETRAEAIAGHAVVVWDVQFAITTLAEKAP